MGNLTREKRRHGVPYLDVLLGPVTHEQVVVGERLKSRSFTYCQAAALQRIGVDKVMTVL